MSVTEGEESSKEVQNAAQTCTLDHEVTIKQLHHQLEEMQIAVKRAERDKESAVVKFAMRESEIMKLSTKLEERTKMVAKLKVEADEMREVKSSKHPPASDGPASDASSADALVRKWKEEACLKDAMYTQCQIKYLAEQTAHAATRTQLDATVNDMRTIRAEVDTTRKECSDLIQQVRNNESHHQQVEQIKSANMIIESSSADQLAAVCLELDQIKSAKETAMIEAEERKACLQAAEDRIVELEATRLKLTRQSADRDSLHCQLEACRVSLAESADQVEQLRTQLTAVQLELDASQARERQSALTSMKMADCNTRLQADLAAIRTDDVESADKCVELQSTVTNLTAINASLTSDLASERQLRAADNLALARRLADTEIKLADSQSLVEGSQCEAAVSKRKQDAAARQLARLTKKLAVKSAPVVVDSQPDCQVNGRHNRSNRSSIASVSDLDKASDVEIASVNSSNFTCRPDDEPYQRLSEKVVRLQQQLVKANEQVESSEANCANLADQLAARSKVVQHLMLSKYDCEHGSHNDHSKKQISGRSGLFASILHGNSAKSIGSKDESMTLEVAMDVNQKLQSVLEDTLMKNIALKDSLDVLTNLVPNI